jgi:hypothetical protein
MFPTESAPDYKPSLPLCRLPAPLGKFLAHLLGIRRFNLLVNLKRRFSVCNSLCAVAECVERQTGVNKRIPLAAAVANLTSKY